MFTCRVVGTVWATRKHRALEGKRMLLVAPVDGITGKTVADPMMAIAGKIDALHPRR
jgi:microcompartment protein CcmK/EutM